MGTRVQWWWLVLGAWVGIWIWSRLHLPTLLNVAILFLIIYVLKVTVRNLRGA